jgi:S1-C subfamily serine protease
MRPCPSRHALILSAVLAAVLARAPARAADGSADPVENSVVKVFSTMRLPDPYHPWNKQSPTEATGSGVVIEGKRILTNAHVVLYASQIQVQGDLAGDKLSAHVEAIAPGIDLAVLRLDDESFFASHPALPRASRLPAVKDPVLVYGFPTGGNNLSTTKGIVSRIEFVGYNYPVSGLRIQIDAAINPGNSGGPAVVDNKMVGLAFSRLGGTAENIGYIIPSEEIDLCLRSMPGGRYSGKPAMHDVLQTLESPALRAFLKLGADVHGIVVNRPDSDDPAYPLRSWDVITRIGDTPIDDQGMIEIGGDLRVSFLYRIQQIVRGGKVPLTIVRDDKTLHIDLPVPTDRPLLVPDLRGAYPRYFIYGPIAFSAATAQFMRGIDSNLAALNALAQIGSPLVSRRGERPAFPGEELVVVASPFFPHALSENYTQPIGHVVKSINGIPIKNLRQLVEVLRDCKDPFVTLRFAERTSEALVFPRADAVAATDDILTDNGIRSQASPDLLAVWNAAPTP